MQIAAITDPESYSLAKALLTSSIEGLQRNASPTLHNCTLPETFEPLMSQGCSQTIPIINRDELLMRMMGSIPMASRMLDRFINNADADCDLIESSVRIGDRKALASLAHRHRGAAQTMAAPRVAQLAFEIEERAASESISNLLLMVDQLRSLIDEVRKEVGNGTAFSESPTGL